MIMVVSTMILTMTMLIMTQLMKMTMPMPMMIFFKKKKTLSEIRRGSPAPATTAVAQLPREPQTATALSPNWPSCVCTPPESMVVQADWVEPLAIRFRLAFEGASLSVSRSISS